MEISHQVGTIGGGALSVDDDPNTTAPDEERIFIARPLTGGIHPTGIDAVAIAAGGTTCDIDIWSFNAQLNRWFNVIGASATVATDTTVMGLTVKPGSSLFVQVTANTGVELVGIGFAGQVENKPNRTT